MSLCVKNNTNSFNLLLFAVNFDYEADYDGEISVKKGDIIGIVDKSVGEAGNMCMVRHLTWDSSRNRVAVQSQHMQNHLISYNKFSRDFS